MHREASSLFESISEIEQLRNIYIFLEKILLDKITLSKEEKEKFQEIMVLVDSLEEKVYELSEM